MKKILYAIGVIAALAIVAGISASVTVAYQPAAVQTAFVARPDIIIKQAAAPKANRFVHAKQPSDVEILLDESLGSGVHIGDGLFITAAHVVAKESKTLNIKLRDKSLRPATVLWSSKDSDIALLHADGADIDASKISCKPVKIGEPISSIGNPLGVESIIAFGRVAGEPRSMGGVKSVFVMDMTVVMGQSGGPVFNDAGEIIGINSMAMVAPVRSPESTGTTYPSLVGYGFAVPSTVICELLARSK